VALRALPAAVLAAVIACHAVVAAQTRFVPSGTTYRVFLSSGEPLPSYGEPALVGDRVIFNLLLGASDGTPEVRLVSLPAAGVDTERTTRYVQAMRAAHYAATRGEADFAALTAEVARVLDELTAATDARRRLSLATNARRALLEWSAAHYQYRAPDIRELAGLFDEVIAELRIAAGEPGVSFDLVAGAPALEPLLPEPTARETVALALSAARAADVGVDRVEILRRAEDVARESGDTTAVRTVGATLAEEVKAGTAYAALISALQTRADAARRRGDVVAVRRLAEELDRRDRQLGEKRPAEVAAFRQQLASTVAATQEFRRALDAHTRQRGALLRYDGQVQPLLARFARVRPVLTVLRDMTGVTPGQLASLESEVGQIERLLAAVRPPAPQVGIHANFRSALRIAIEACARRRQATSSRSPAMQEASAAAAGAILLSEQVRHDLASSLRPPTIQ
jgi:hypothetical protein